MIRLGSNIPGCRSSRKLVEAAGVEPTSPQNANWLMARDFRRNSLEIRCLVVKSLCSGALPSLVGVGTPVARRPPGRPAPPAQIRTCGTTASGSHLG